MFTLHQERVVMSSPITHTVSNIHPLAHIHDTWALIFSSCALVTNPLQVMTTMARLGSQKEHFTKQEKWPCETQSVAYAPGLSLFSIFLPLSCSLHRHSSCPRPPSHHPFSPTSVYLIPILRLLPPSTPFWPYGTHQFFPHAQTISILSDLLYSLTPFIF